MQNPITTKDTITAPPVTITSTSTVTVTATACAGDGQNTGATNTGPSMGDLQEPGQQPDEESPTRPEDSGSLVPAGSRPIAQVPSGASDPSMGDEDMQYAPGGGVVPLPNRPLSTGDAGLPQESTDMNPNSESAGSGGLIDGQSPTSDQRPIPSMPSQEGNGAIQNSGYGSSQDVQRPGIQEASPPSVAEDVGVSTTGSKSNTSISSTHDYVPPAPSNGFDQDEIGSNTSGNAGQTSYISDSNDPNESEPVPGSASHGAGPSAANSSNALPPNDEVDYGSVNLPSGGVMSDGYAGQGTGQPVQGDPAKPAISIVPPFNNASSMMPPVIPPGSDDVYQPNADGMPPYQNSIVSSPMPNPTSPRPTVGTRVTKTTTMEVYPEPMTTSSGNAQPPSQSESASEGIYGGKDDSILPTEDGSISPSGSTSMALTEPSGNGSTPARLESQMPAPHVPVSNSTFPTSLSPPISSPIPGDTSFQPPGDPTQRVPQSSPPATISDNSQPCVPNSNNKYLQAS
ncbi:MAG: hypothetical protein Q9183_005553, partial [Haloplaca sp. 2 TL-2023]